ncbi:MAG: 50S ribosomal protein L30 [Firmicutes bacterium]|nr:50S ribosomal protein L30 [Bacillota bacterium]
MANKLKITWVKSTIGYPENQRLVIQALGLKKLHHTVVQNDTPEIRGMIRKVEHLVVVQEIEA